MKKTIKYLCPPILWDLLNQARSLTHRSRTGVVDDRVKLLESNFRQLNTHISGNSIAIRPAIELYIHPESRKAFEFFCYRSPVMVDEMDSFLRETANTMNFLDIGALHGIFSLVFAANAPNRRVLAIDASPIAFARLLYNIHKNQFANIEPIECAVTENSGMLKMHYEWEHAVAAGTTEQGKLLEVQADTADNICKERGFSPDAIKIDVEGHEIKVLRGMKETIKDCKPIIFLEVHPSRIAEEGDSIGEIETIFSKLNYSAKGIDGEIFPLSLLRDLVDDERIILSPNVEQIAVAN